MPRKKKKITKQMEKKNDGKYTVVLAFGSQAHLQQYPRGFTKPAANRTTSCQWKKQQSFYWDCWEQIGYVRGVSAKCFKVKYTIWWQLQLTVIMETK